MSVSQFRRNTQLEIKTNMLDKRYFKTVFSNGKIGLGLCMMAFLVMGTSAIVAQQISGVFEEPTVNGKTLYLAEYYGKDYSKIDSTTISNTGTFEFAKKKYTKGLYRVSLNGQNNDVEEENYMNLLLGGNAAIGLKFSDAEDLRKGAYVENCVDNQCLITWENKKNDIRAKIRNTNKMIRSTPKSDIAHREKLVLTRDSFRVYEQEYLQYLLDSDYNAPIFKDIYNYYLFPSHDAYVKKGNTAFNSDKSFHKAHFFDKIDFHRDDLKRTHVYQDMSWYYINNYISYDEMGFITAVDKIMDLVSGNDEVRDMMIKFLAMKFYQNGPKAIFQYVVENYLLEEGCGDLELDDGLKLLADVYESLLPGNRAPDLQMLNVDNQMMSVESVTKSNIGTILFFWSSHCKYCKAAVPELKKIHAEYKAKGVEIIGISIDNHRKSWTDAIDKYELDWVNLSDLKGWKSKAIETYKVHKTPGFYLLSKDMTIVSKPKTVHLLRKDVEGLF